MENKKTTLGLIGGTSWVSTADYYRFINEKVNEKLGGLNFARCLVFSLNYGDLHACNMSNDPEGVYRLLLDAGKRLRAAGASCLVLCANTLHQYAERLEQEIPLPLIHIADATAGAIKADRFTKVGLMGTMQTMEMAFYSGRLKKHGIETIVPDKEERDFIENTIRYELVKGIVKTEARQKFLEIMEGLHQRGAQGIILGCTEIPLLVGQEHTAIRLYNTTEIHAGSVVEFFLQ